MCARAFLAVLLVGVVSACGGGSSGEPGPSPDGGSGEMSAAACDISAPCTAGRCPGARKITFGTQRCALLCDKTVRCSEPGDLFTELADSAPLELVLSNARDLVAGAQHTCALLEDGTVQCWGDNHWGVLGYHPAGTGPLYTPELVPGVTDVVALSSRDAFYQADWTCALLGSGKVQCWGSRLSGITEIPELSGARAIRVGDHRVTALMNDRDVRVYRARVGVSQYRLAEAAAHLAAGWHGFCGGDGRSLQCMDEVYQPELTVMKLPGAYREVAQEWDAVLIVDEQGKILRGQASEPETWQPTAGLDGAVYVATNASVMHQVCGLFADGRIECNSH